MIRVIGIDRKIHIANAYSDITKCGIKIQSKKIPNNCKLFSCYECTY